MPSARIHEAIAKKINKEIRMDELLLRIGTVAPDSWRNALPKSSNKDKYLSSVLFVSLRWIFFTALIFFKLLLSRLCSMYSYSSAKSKTCVT